MNLKEYFTIIYKRIWLIIILPILASLASAYMSFYVIKPTYEANTTMYVLNKKSGEQLNLGQSELLGGQLLVKDYRELIKSRSITENVIEQLGIKDVKWDKFADKISVEAKNDTRVIEIKVENEDPEMAKNIANKLGDTFRASAIDLMGVDNVHTFDKAKTPSDPIKPRSYINIGIGFLTGFLFAVGLILLMEYMDSTIKTGEDVENKLGLPVIGTIPVFSIK